MREITESQTEVNILKFKVFFTTATMRYSVFWNCHLLILQKYTNVSELSSVHIWDIRILGPEGIGFTETSENLYQTKQHQS